MKEIFLRNRRMHWAYLILMSVLPFNTMAAIIAAPPLPEPLDRTISGTVSDSKGESLPGVNIVVKGALQGTTTNTEGKYSLVIPDENVTLIFSFVGYETQEVIPGARTTLDITLQESERALDEVVVVGYGTMKKADLTGAVVRADIDMFRDQPNVSILQSLQGSVAGLNIGQVSQAGQNPGISIRGQTSISGAQNPLIVLDGVIFRGNLMDINPDDIESIDVLKDNSAAAVYGSQASNGVLLLTSKSGKGVNRKPIVSYSSSYSYRTPTFELRPGSAEDFIRKNIEIDFLQSRTAESGYIDVKPDYPPEANFKDNQQTENYRRGKSTDWYDLVTNDHVYIHSHNLSLTSKTENLNYFISAGFTDEQGYMINENYKRYNARMNVDSRITNWLTIGVQSFASISDNSGENVNTATRYSMPYDAAFKENGELNPYIEGGVLLNPLVAANADNLNLRNNVFGNIFANIELPFIKGLGYKVNFYNNYVATRNYYFQPYAQNFQGTGGKNYSHTHDMSSDHILSYKRKFGQDHNLDLTLLYGFEKRKNDATQTASSVFIDPVLGYNRLQSGSTGLRSTNSYAWEEASIYNMARLFYSFRNRYLITGTIRRDGFSGFSEKNKFGIFPSFALGWVASEESFLSPVSFINYLKLRASYGSIGNRTVGRYQTLATVSGGYNYINATGNSIYTKSINSLASTDLKWETTTGVNLGLDFEILNSRITGSAEYYNNNTTDLLYDTDIPFIGRFPTFPDNLGKMHNQGIELTLSSVNLRTTDFTWSSGFTFSRNRDKLKKLLGFDNNGDGKEDDLVSEKLFIGEPLNVVHHYEITGDFHQLGDNVPTGAQVGSFVIVDQNGDGKIDRENDFKILGYTQPAYRFSITNKFSYKNWSLNVFVNSVQGGKKHYLHADNLLYQDLGSGFNNPYGNQHWTLNFPKGLDYWLPENPNARYQRIGGSIPPQLTATRWTQRNFVRLQDVSLAYAFNSSLLNNLNIRSLRLFINAKNLFTWTKWPGWDPETGEGITRTGRPVLQSYTAGFSIEL